MAETKNYGLSGVAPELELGLDGPKLVNESGSIAAKNNANNALVTFKAANPVADTDVVTKGYLERNVDVRVTGQIDGGSPPAAINGVTYICTTTGGTYTAKNLYRGENSAWVEIVPTAGLKMVVTVALTGGDDEYLGDHIYLWDADTSVWIDIGPYMPIAPTNTLKSERADLVFNSAASINIGSPVPADARPIDVIVNVTQAFNGTPTLKVGDGTDDDRLMTTAEVNLKKVGIYRVGCYHNYASATQLLAAYAAGGATSGAAQIEVVYTNA